MVVFVVVLDDVVVCVVVTGGVGPVVVDFVVAVVVTGAARVTDAVVVTTGAGVVTVAAVAVVLAGTACFLRWDFLWCTARLCGATATDDVALDVVEEGGLVDTAEVVELLPPPELPQPTIITPAITVSSAAFIRPTPVVDPRLVPKANNG